MKRAWFLVLIASLSAPLWSEPGSPSPEVSFEGIRFFGADVGLRSGDWKLTLGGGWESLALGRDEVSGLPLEANSQGSGKSYRTSDFPNAAATVGWITKNKGLEFWADLGGLVHGDAGWGSPSSGAFADLRGNSFAFVQAGLRQDSLVEDTHHLKTGFSWELSGEWGPSWADVRSASYAKLRALTAAHLLLWDLEAPHPLLSGLVAFRANARWLDGSPVPVAVLESTEVRGYSRLLDTKVRTVGSAELRLGLPSLAWLLDLKPLVDELDLVPVVLFFAEGGWYQGYANAPEAVASQSGFLASVGAGAGVSIFGAVTPTLQWALPLSDGESLPRLNFFFNHRF